MSGVLPERPRRLQIGLRCRLPRASGQGADEGRIHRWGRSVDICGLRERSALEADPRRNLRFTAAWERLCVERLDSTGCEQHSGSILRWGTARSALEGALFGGRSVPEE